MKEQNEISWTIPLVKSIRYTSYQFYAKSEPAYNISVEQLFIKEILYVLNWIKNKHIGRDNPDEVILPNSLKDIPKPDDFAKVKLDELKSFRYNLGYQLEVIISKDQKSWAMNMREPDLGPMPDKPELARKSVSGRYFETDIGLRRHSNYVAIATRTYVHEPAGTKEECDAFRQAFLSEFIQDKNIKLCNDYWPISDKPYEISNMNSYQTLIKWLKNNTREALAVVYTDKPAEKIELEKEKKEETEETSETVITDYTEAFKEMARKNRAYAFFFYIPYNKRDIFLKDVASVFATEKTSFITDDTDLFIIDAKKYENSCLHSFSIEQYCADDPVKQTIYRRIRKYYERKNVNFQSVKFVTDLENLSDQNTDEFNKNNEDLLREIDQWKDKYNSQKKNYEANLIEEQAKKYSIKKQWKEEVKRLNEELSKEKSKCKACEEKQKNVMEEKDAIIERLKKRPKKFEDIPKWVEDNFSDTLIMCDRAKKEIANTDLNYDFDSICNALEFLALDHYEYLTGRLTEQEINDRGSRIYNCKFRIKNAAPPAAGNKTDYEFNYYRLNGLKVKGEIDSHIYLEGSATRIYYTFDKTDRRIIIASLPKHLKT